MRKTVKIFGVAIDEMKKPEVLEKIKVFLKQDVTRTIYTPNTEIVMECRENSKLKDILNRGDIVIPDGIGLIYASKIKKKGLTERVTGCDVSADILDIANIEGYSLFLLGGQPGVAEEASEKIAKKYPNIKLVGTHDGYFKGTHTGNTGHAEEIAVVDQINKSKADILFVGLGAPKQELWIDENKDNLNCKVIIGNGGTIDILAERVKRAPEVYQKLGLEWLYRLSKDPTRIKRQMVIPIFILTILFSREETVE